MDATSLLVRGCGRLASVLIALAPALVAQTTERVSVDSAGQEANGGSIDVVISRDGRYVVFSSAASNLVANDTNAILDVFRHDRNSGATVRVSVDSKGTEANGTSRSCAVSDDGNLVAFVSMATNLVAGDTNAYQDVFVRDLAAGTTERVSVDSSGAEANGFCAGAAMSGDGRFVAFHGNATNLVAGDSNGCADIFLRNRSSGTTTRVSVSTTGGEADRDCLSPAISKDGNFVAFQSDARHLVGNDPYGYIDVFLRDVAAGKTSQVSLTLGGGRPSGDSVRPSISDAGDRVAFESTANDLVTGDHSHYDVFVRDVPGATTTRASLSSAGEEPNGECEEAHISGDGVFVAFESTASNLVDHDVNASADVFVRSLSNSMTTRASVASDGTGADGDGGSPAISADGTSIGFNSIADNLVAGDANGAWDVFVRSRVIAPASASGYGTGFAGTHGIPGLSVRQSPILNADVSLDVDNSSGAWTLAFLVVGAAPADIATNRGGHLLVLPIRIFVYPLPPAGATLVETVPPLEELAGVHVYLQVLEIDAGATYGFSFTPALDLGLGY